MIRAVAQRAQPRPGQRPARDDDWAVLPFARSITDSLQRSGHTGHCGHAKPNTRPAPAH
ncbi:hypothetical protein IV102_36790 [bacterium]|nr:hypothetical protein [bacterium]